MYSIYPINNIFEINLLGLSDRYKDTRGLNWPPKEYQGTTVHKGYEKIIMGDATYTNLNKAQYRAWMEHAVSRAKTNNNTNRIIGLSKADSSLKTGL